MSAKTRRTRRKRRQSRAFMSYGWKAKPTHRLKSGRTGATHHKNLKGRILEASRRKEKDK